jgi:LysR family glycine cleavage system transcriptional activator
MHMPSLQTLRAFDAAGRHQSYSKAGRELGLTHSAISHRIRELEALLGTRLFERQGNCMVPTADGVRLLGQVRNALGLLESIFTPSGEQKKRRLTISVFPALSPWLIPRLGSFRALHPGLDLRLDLSSRPVELGDGVDAAVRYGLGSWTNTDASLLAKEILFPVCSPKYLAEHPLNGPGDLLNCNLLRHPWHSWAAWFEAAGVSAGEPLSGPEYADSSLLIEAAEAGEGVALARALGVADRLDDGNLVQPFDISIPDQRAYYFVRPKGLRNADVDEIEGWLANEFHRVQQASDSEG